MKHLNLKTIHNLTIHGLSFDRTYNRAFVLNLVTLQLILVTWESDEDSIWEVVKPMIPPKEILIRFAIGAVIGAVIGIANYFFKFL